MRTMSSSPPPQGTRTEFVELTTSIESGPELNGTRRLRYCGLFDASVARPPGRRCGSNPTAQADTTPRGESSSPPPQVIERAPVVTLREHLHADVLAHEVAPVA